MRDGRAIGLRVAILTAACAMVGMVAIAGCDAPPPEAKAEQALTFVVGNCASVPGVPTTGAILHTVNSKCITLTNTGSLDLASLQTTNGRIDHASVANGTHLWFCDHNNPGVGLPITGTSYAPCFVSQTVGDELRTDGPSVRGFDPPWAIKSAKLDVAWLPKAPNCPFINWSSLNTHTTFCNYTGSSGDDNVTVSVFGSFVSVNWPDGTSGSPCYAEDDGLPVEVNYSTCPGYSKRAGWR